MESRQPWTKSRAKARFGLKKEPPVAFSATVTENCNSGATKLDAEYPSVASSRHLENSDECLQQPSQVSVRTSRRSRDMFLIRRAQAGDAEAFGQMVTNYRTRIFTLVYDIVRNEHDACDLVQEVFLKPWQSIHRFENRSEDANLAINTPGPGHIQPLNPDQNEIPAASSQPLDPPGQPVRP